MLERKDSVMLFQTSWFHQKQSTKLFFNALNAVLVNSWLSMMFMLAAFVEYSASRLEWRWADIVKYRRILGRQALTTGVYSFAFAQAPIFLCTQYIG